MTDAVLGSPPPSGLKNVVPKLRSVSSMVLAPASTGSTKIPHGPDESTGSGNQPPGLGAPWSITGGVACVPSRKLPQLKVVQGLERNAAYLRRASQSMPCDQPLMMAMGRSRATFAAMPVSATTSTTCSTSL
jgi:hypothetical protein